MGSFLSKVALKKQLTAKYIQAGDLLNFPAKQEREKKQLEMKLKGNLNEYLEKKDSLIAIFEDKNYWKHGGEDVFSSELESIEGDLKAIGVTSEMLGHGKIAFYLHGNLLETNSFKKPAIRANK